MMFRALFVSLLLAGCLTDPPGPTACWSTDDDCSTDQVCHDSAIYNARVCDGPTKAKQPCGGTYPNECNALGEGLICTGSSWSHHKGSEGMCRTPCSSDSDCPGPFDDKDETNL